MSDDPKVIPISRAPSRRERELERNEWAEMEADWSLPEMLGEPGPLL